MSTKEPQAGVNVVKRFLRRPEGGLLLSIVVVVIVTTLVDDRHNYWHNPGPSAIDILRQTAFLGIFALGAAIVIIAGGIDLSSGSVIAFAGSFCAAVMVVLAPQEMLQSKPVGSAVIIAAIVATLIVGLLIGSMHAWLITIVGLPPFVATLATLVGLRSLGRAMVENVTLSVWEGRKSQIQVPDEQFRYLATQVWIPVTLFALLALICWVLMSRTVVGRHLHALGGNEEATRLSGIRTDRLKWLAYCIAALLSSLAGILYVGQESAATPQTLGRGYELNAIAAAVVGGCSLKGGVGTIPGTVLGTLFLRVVIDGVAKMIKVGADVYEGMIVGSIVVMAVAFNELRRAGSRGKQFFPGALGLVTIVNLTLLAGTLMALVGPGNWGSWTGSSVAAAGALVLLLAVRLYESRNSNP